MLILLLLLCAFQTEEIATEELGPLAAQEIFTKAVEKFNSIERKDAQPLFEALVRNLESKTANPEDRRMLLESLNYLAVVTYPEGSESWYRKMISVDPGYDLPLDENIPPKIRAIYERLRKELLGRLRISARDLETGEPLDRVILLVDGAIVGPVNGEKLVTLAAGTRKIELIRPNYSGGESTLNIAAGGETAFHPQMKRISAEAIIVTIPPDVEILSKGQSLGFTRAPAPEIYRDRLAAEGIALENAGVFVLDRLEIGDHEITLSRPCYISNLSAIPVRQIKQTLIKPLQLRPAEAFLSVSTPSGENGNVLLNGTQIGILPLENHKVCPGSYELRVQFSDGSYVLPLTLAEGDKREITAQPQPSLAWLGLDLRDEGAPPQDPNLWIRELKNWALLQTPLPAADLALVAPLFSGKAPDREQQAALARFQEADLYLAARVVRHKQVIRRMEVAFWSPRSSHVQTFAFDFRELERFREVLRDLDRQLPTIKPWLGIQVGRLEGVPGCQILEVDPRGPLAGLVQPGEIIRAVSASPLRHPGELTNLASFAELTLEIGERQVLVKPVPTIAEVAFDAATSVPPAMIAMFAKIAKYDSDALRRQSAQFNMARFLFFTGEFKPAFDIFSTMQLPAGPGINAGTLHFYQGLCFRKLNLSSEAQDAFRQVLNFPDATLYDAYGPRAAFWAEAELKNTSF